MPTAPEDWSYRLHFEGWQSTYAQSFPGTRTVPDNLTCPCRHDDWFAADLLMPYEVQEPEPPPPEEPAAAAGSDEVTSPKADGAAAAEPAEDTAAGDDEWDSAMAAEEEGNQWLYSCIMCGDGRDVVMCEACPRVYHIDCLGQSKVGRGGWCVAA